MPDDEAGYIALHIHTAKADAKSMYSAMKHTTMIKEMIEKIESFSNRRWMKTVFPISASSRTCGMRSAGWTQMKHSIPWTRRCFISSKKYPFAYRCALELAAFLKMNMIWNCRNPRPAISRCMSSVCKNRNNASVSRNRLFENILTKALSWNRMKAH